MMDFIAQNIEFSLTIIGLFIAVIAFFFTKDNILARCLVGLCAIVCLILAVKYIRTWNLVRVPNVTNLPYNEARVILRSHDLIEQPLTGNSSVLPLDDNVIVIRQVPMAGSQCKENEVVCLFFSEENVEEDETKNEEIYSTEPLQLAINIENVASFYDGYHYEHVNPQNLSENYIIDFDTGISGTFSYSRELTAAEIKNWMHGGRIYDSNGNEIGDRGNYPVFWSSPDGKFAVQLPKNLQPGEYVYELYQFINDQEVSDKITFIVQ